MHLQLDEVSHVYRAGLPGAVRALDRVSLVIPPGSFVVVLGGTGAGKSTLAWHLNGLLRPTAGRVLADGEVLPGRGEGLRRLRQRVGLAMQYPEQQLFAETVRQEVAYGLRRAGLRPGEVETRVAEALCLAGLEAKADRSPFALSGGEQRRLALAGVLAQQPEVVVLDEPTAGLDTPSRRALLQVLDRWRRQREASVVFITHRPEEVAEWADRLVVMQRGRVVREGDPREVLGDPAGLAQYGLEAPAVNRLLFALREAGWPVRTGCLSTAEAAAEILACLGRREGKACSTE